MLEQLGQKPPYSFAYPCGETYVGEGRESYIPLIEARFSAARGVLPALVDPASSRFEIPSFFLKSTGDDLIARAESARSESRWIVYGFHGIGGDVKKSLSTIQRFSACQKKPRFTPK
jgi:hypothetical protein